MNYTKLLDIRVENVLKCCRTNQPLGDVIPRFLSEHFLSILPSVPL